MICLTLLIEVEPIAGYSKFELNFDPEQYLDDWPFIWYNYSKGNYITGFLEDSTYSTFNYLKKGFNTTVGPSAYVVTWK